jgi:dolichol-phosphate mannosyltransferase
MPSRKSDSSDLLPPTAACLPRFLTALPVYNEAQHVTEVLDEVVKYSGDVLVVDDGSTDGTRDLLLARGDVDVVEHSENRGYGAALRTAFEYAVVHRYDVVVTIDCDGQHEPQRITQLVKECWRADIVSGSRYLQFDQNIGEVPPERLRINRQITKELNKLLGLELTDTFCGFKAYRTTALAELELTENGYAMPLELWVQAARRGLRIVEMPVPLIYLDQERSFGGVLDAADTRLKYYREVIQRAMDRFTAKPTVSRSGRGCPGAAACS